MISEIWDTRWRASILLMTRSTEAKSIKLRFLLMFPTLKLFKANTCVTLTQISSLTSPSTKKEWSDLKNGTLNHGKSVSRKKNYPFCRTIGISKKIQLLLTWLTNRAPWLVTRTLLRQVRKTTKNLSNTKSSSNLTSKRFILVACWPRTSRLST